MVRHPFVLFVLFVAHYYYSLSFTPASSVMS